jgi:hypothetical protein
MYTKTGKYTHLNSHNASMQPNDRKIDHIVVKYATTFLSKTRQNFAKSDFFGLEIYNLATLRPIINFGPRGKL